MLTYFDNIRKYVTKYYRVTSQKTKKADTITAFITPVFSGTNCRQTQFKNPLIGIIRNLPMRKKKQCKDLSVKVTMIFGNIK